MDAKDLLLAQLLPRAALKALTPEAIEAVPHSLLIGDTLVIREFPFRVGRESRVRKVNGGVERIERSQRDKGNQTNDLYLIDRGHLLNISREHFQIEETDDGFVLLDRGSACGTKIGTKRIGGGGKEGRQVLHDGDIIAIGAKGTLYRFEFVSFAGYEICRKDQAA